VSDLRLSDGRKENPTGGECQYEPENFLLYILRRVELVIIKDQINLGKVDELVSRIKREKRL